MTYHLGASLSALLIASASSAYAAEPDAATLGTSAAVAAADSADPIVVTGQRPEYGVRATSSATRTHTDIKNIPQALTVISESQIEDQNLRSIADVLMFVPGATPGTGESNRDQFTLRGQNSTADFFVNGIRDDVQYFRDLYNLDRLEVLKGPNAMVFGRGGGGGVINRVTKRSSLDSYREFSTSADSEGGVRLTGDVDQPLSANAGLRVNAMIEEGNSFRDHVDLDRHAISPTVGIQAGADTRIDLTYEYLHDRRTTDRGVPSLGGRPLKGFDSVFFGNPDLSFADADVHIANVAVQHDFGNGLSLRNRSQVGDYDKLYQNVYPRSAVSDANVSFAAYRDTTTRRNLFSQTDLIWENRLGGIDQTLLVGVEVGGQKGRNQRRNGVFGTDPSAPRNISQPLSDVTFDGPVTFVANGNNSRVRTSVAAFYVQDQVRLLPTVEILAGLRFDSFTIDADDLASGQSFERKDDLWSPRLGLVFKPRPNLSLYASYARSYLPSAGDQFNSLDITDEALEPERFDNVEIGGKWEPLPGLLATVALYQLDRTNTRAADPLNPGRIVATGEQRSRGLEVGLERSVTDRWQISAGYALQKAEITEATSAAPEGREAPLVPRHSFSLWNRYDASDRLSLGLGVIARSSSYASISNAVKLPGYARVDAALFYDLLDGVQAQLNIENVFGADYFPTAHNDNNIAPGAPTTARATLRLRL